MEDHDLCVDGLRLVAAEEAEGGVETAADRGVVLEERAEMPLQGQSKRDDMSGQQLWEQQPGPGPGPESRV